jgi:hypothetical protein
VTAYRLHQGGRRRTDGFRCSPRLHQYSFELVQIGVGSRVTQFSAHGNDLAFVMKGMRKDMMKDERRSAHGDVPIGEMKLRVGIQLLMGQGRQISVG